MGHPEQQLEVAEAGRAEKVLAHQLGLSRRVLAEWLRGGRIRRNGALLRKGDRLEAGDALALRLDGPIGGWVIPAAPPLPVLARGDGWIAIDKPAGMPSHPSMPFEGNCGLNHIAAHAPLASQCGADPLQGGLVHRLDNDTSGILLAATEPSTWQTLRALFSAQDVQRIYRARVQPVDAEYPVGEGMIEQRLSARGARVVVDDAGRATRTRWRSLDDHGLLELELLTGHRHQIRVHLAAMGWPVVGDPLYGGAQAARLLLHACRLRFGDQETISTPPDPLRSPGM